MQLVMLMLMLMEMMMTTAQVTSSELTFALLHDKYLDGEGGALEAASKRKVFGVIFANVMELVFGGDGSSNSKRATVDLPSRCCCCCCCCCSCSSH